MARPQVRVKRKGEKEEGSPAWMTTFGDLNTQILVFFVLLISLMQEKVKVQALMEVIRGIFTREKRTIYEGPDFIRKYMINYSPEVERRGGKINVKSVEGVHWKVQSVRQGLKITLHGKAAAFEPGSYELPAAYYEVLGKLRKMLAGTYNWVEIRGYTDSWPHDTLEKSHRLLGFKRAMAVYEELIKTASGEEPLDWRRFRVEGCGKIEPVDINSTADGRARNRRVEVIVTEEFYKAPEK